MKTMKKAISVLLLVCMVSALCSAGAYADNTAGAGGEGGTTPDFYITLDNACYTVGKDSVVTATAALPDGSTATDYNISWYVNDVLNWQNQSNGQLYASWNLSQLNNGDTLYATATKNGATKLTSNTLSVNIVDPATLLTAEITLTGYTLTAKAKLGENPISITSVTWTFSGNVDPVSADNSTATAQIKEKPYDNIKGTVSAEITVDDGRVVKASIDIDIPATKTHATSIVISNNPTTLTVGNPLTLKPEFNPSTADDSEDIQWTITSSNSNKFNITKAGIYAVISAAKDATFSSDEQFTVCAYIPTDTGSIQSDELTIKVVPATVEATGITITPNPVPTLYVADGKNTVKLTATAAPEGSSLKDLTWSSDKENVASVDSNGLVTAKAVGTATITAKAKDSVTNKELTQTINITVAPIQVEKIELSETASTMTVKDTKTITATVLPVTASQKALTWQSSDASIASVAVDSADSSKVIITANKVGTADITATAIDSSNVSAKYTVTVTEPAAYRINLTPNTITLGQGNVNYFTATILDKDGKNVSGSDKSITWSFTGDTSDGIGITSNGYNSTNNNYTATVLGKFNRNYVVTASCSIGGVVYSSSASVTVSFTPAIVSGQNAVYNGRDAMSFVVNDSAQNFNGHVYVDGRELSNVYYSTSNYNGYLVVTLNQSFLNFLCQYYNNNGYHTLSVDTKYGAAASYFRTWGTASSFNGVKTGDDANLGLWVALLAVSAVGAGAAVIIVKRRKTNNG